MDLIKYYGKIILYFIGFLLLGSLLMSVGYYFFLSTKFIKTLALIYLIVLFFVFSFKEGHKAAKQGYIAGIKTGSLFIFILLMFNIIFYRNFHINSLIYYLILLAVAILGSMVGINAKKN